MQIDTNRTLKQSLDSIKSFENGHNSFMKASFDMPNIQAFFSNNCLKDEIPGITLAIGIDLTRIDILGFEKPHLLQGLENCTIAEFLTESLQTFNAFIKEDFEKDTSDENSLSNDSLLLDYLNNYNHLLNFVLGRQTPPKILELFDEILIKALPL